MFEDFYQGEAPAALNAVNQPHGLDLKGSILVINMSNDSYSAMMRSELNRTEKHEQYEQNSTNSTNSANRTVQIGLLYMLYLL